jgi:beta-glucosidase
MPHDFIWGAATSAYQIEGATETDGRGPSIWDTFSRRAGTTANGDTGAVACDHYHRWRDDIALMQQLGIDAYRLSIAWPRICPHGDQTVNQRGLDFYDRLVDGLLEAGITPFVTLYMWDLPQALEDRGGWPERATVTAFTHYVDAVTRRLGDRVKHWMTLNEPWVYCIHGYKSGWHAPGHRTGDDWTLMLRAVHHSLLAHGSAVPILRRNVADAQVGIVLNLTPFETINAAPENLAAVQRCDGALNRWFLDPLYCGHYPADMLEVYGSMAPTLHPDDMATIAVPTDFLGVNYYFREVIEHHPTENGLLQHRKLHSRSGSYPEIWPDGLRDMLLRVTHDYQPRAIYITENGLGCELETVADGQIHDLERITYLREHIAAVQQARTSGVPVRGYFVWSLLDNFEWAFGYRMRFGMHYVDYATQQRIPKASAHWYADMIRNQRLNSGLGTKKA